MSPFVPGIGLFVMFAVKLVLAGVRARPRNRADRRRADADTLARLDRIAEDSRRRRR